MIARLRSLQQRLAWLDDDIKAQSAVALLMVALMVLSCVLVIVTASAPSTSSKIVLSCILLPIALGLLAHSTFTLQKARARYQCRQRAAEAHLSEQDEVCKQLAGDRFVDVILSHNGFV